MNRRKIKIKIYSKINLSLNILGTHAGMHVLDSVMTSADIADVITVCERFDDELNVEFSRGSGVGEDNTAVRAAKLLREKFGSFGADIFVEKNIPLCSGLGGSSADAAAVITALDTLFDFRMRGLSPCEAALRIGSDVPFMLSGGFARVSGTGGNVERIDSDCEFYFVIARGKNGVSTKESYAEFDALHADKKLILSDNAALCEALAKGDAAGAIHFTGNALEKPSKKLDPEIAGTLSSLCEAGAVKSIMTGSGSACAGFFPSFAAAQDAAEKLRGKGLWAVASRSVKNGVEFL